MESEFLDNVEEKYFVIEYNEDGLREKYDLIEFAEFRLTEDFNSYRVLNKEPLCFEDAESLMDGETDLEGILEEIEDE